MPSHTPERPAAGQHAKWPLVGSQSLCILFAVACLCLLLPTLAVQADEASAVEKVDFATQVLPLLKRHCFECHSHAAGESNGQLMLDSLEAMKNGGTRGVAVVPGDVTKGEFLKAIAYDDVELQMPPDGKLGDREIALLQLWIEQGANFPASHSVRPAQAKPGTDGPIAAASTHWAYQPISVAAHTTSETHSTGLNSDRWRERANNFIDFAIGHNLNEAGLDFSPRATRSVLIKRISYDLTGLPPTSSEIQSFADDSRPDEVVYVEMIDRLLASPRFGERWSRYWMDVARYADNKGYVFQEDREYPEAYRYRDWLIAAFNSDLPYDQFVKQQLAADLLPGEDTSNVPALGFLTLGRRFLNNKYDIIDDRLDVTSRGLMGMTLACARCHDHKYDPVSQEDYYSLFSVFLNTEEPGGAPWPHRLSDTTKQRDAFVLLRGSPGARGKKVSPRFVSVLNGGQSDFKNGSGRLELAERIAAEDNPLTARVFANRVWMRLTGASLVESPSDFGTRCPEPEQLPLLDGLANHLLENDWSTKSLIRAIVTSRTYCQASQTNEEGAEKDPANGLYWRMNRRRLDFEGMRDTLLQRAGLLDNTLGGKSEEIHEAPFSRRRTVYSYIDRQNLPNLFRTFDVASPDTHSPRRIETSVPQQGLYLLNSQFVAELASSLVSQLQGQIDNFGFPGAKRDELRAQVHTLFEQILARAPTPEELELFCEFLSQPAVSSDSFSLGKWMCGYGEVDLNANRLVSFQDLPKIVNGSWQGGDKLPDFTTGWCSLNASGGHPGNDSKHAVVRRWISPADGEIIVRGKLSHPQDKGDGVRSMIFSEAAVLGSWVAHHRTVDTQVQRAHVKKGQIVDFVTSCRSSPSHDSFQWSVKITHVDETKRRRTYDSVKDFPLDRASPMDAWAQAAQALLATNELSFVD